MGYTITGKTKREYSDFETDEGTIDGEEADYVRAAQSDPLKFDVLYTCYMPRVYRYVRMRTINEEDAADITQQIFLQALKALPKYELRKVPFAAWLFRIASNTVTETYRQSHPTISWGTLPEILHPTHDNGPESAMLHKEALTRLSRLLDNLDPYQRELLFLRFSGGLSTPKIAVVVGKRPDAVKKQLTRLLQSLKEHYNEA